MVVSSHRMDRREYARSTLGRQEPPTLTGAPVFVTDLLIDPSTRGVTDIKHEIVAVASSSSAEKAKKFIADFKCPPSTRAYGSYADLVADPAIDIVYIATPHSHHYQNALLCLHAGKPVLCEKAFTVNEAQARALVTTAREKNLFLMEAVWTRYFPLSVKIRELLQSGAIGPVHRAVADLGAGEDVERKWPAEHRMRSPALAGGALLDLGIYALTWVFQALYHTVPEAERAPPSSVAAVVAPHGTGVDEATAVLLGFPKGPAGAGYAQGVATTSLRLSTDCEGACAKAGCPAIRIQGAKGEVQVFHPAFRPTRYRVVIRKDDGSEAEVREEEMEVPGGGKGFFWEADEAARCLRDGKLESSGLGWEESCVIMGVMDEVRKRGGITYPDKIETTEYPVDL